MSNQQSSLVTKAVGNVIGLVVYNEFKDHFRRAEVRVRIRRHVKMAEEVKKRVNKNQY